MAGVEEINSMIASLRKLGGDAFVADAAKQAAPLIEAELKKTAAAGTDPDGKKWKPLKDGGGQALKDAPSAIKVEAKGDIIAMRVTGKYAFHNYGTGRDPKRRMLPDSPHLPDALAKAVREGAARAFRRATGGAP